MDGAVAAHHSQNLQTDQSVSWVRILAFMVAHYKARCFVGEAPNPAAFRL